MKKEKTYTFECTVHATGFGSVTANYKKEAMEKLERGEWDGIVDEINCEYQEFRDLKLDK